MGAELQVLTQETLLEARQTVSHGDVLTTRVSAIINSLHAHPALGPVLVAICREGPCQAPEDARPRFPQVYGAVRATAVR